MSNPLTVTLQAVTGGYQGFALLKAPKDFVRPASAQADAAKGLQFPRALYANVAYTPSGGPMSANYSKYVSLHRPPVVLIHGLTGEPSNFNWDLLADSRLLVYRADYHTTHDASFLTNLGVLTNAVAQAVQIARNRGIASTQADVVGHSMGGLLARLAALNVFEYPAGVPHTSRFVRDDNFGAGDIHKLITVNTPHYGSPVSDLLVTPANDFTELGSVAQTWTSRDIRGGATRDLRTDGDLIRLINVTPPAAPFVVHAIVGSDVAEGASTEFYQNRTWSMSVACQKSIAYLFGGPNDLVVSVTSQAGGLSGSAVTVVNGEEGWHYPTVHDYPSGPANNAVLSLLDASVASDAFAPAFPLNAGPYPGRPDCLFPEAEIKLQRQLLLRPGAQVDIAGGRPSEPTFVEDPHTITLSAAPLATFVPKMVGFCTSFGAMVRDSTAPYQAEIAIPYDVCGRQFAWAVAYDSTSWTVSDTVYFDVAVNSVARTLAIEGGSVVLTERAPKVQLPVSWVDGRGFKHALSDCDPGARYMAYDTTIASVNAAGELLGKRLGTTTVQVTLLGKTASAAVNVLGLRGDYNHDGRIDSVDSLAFLACKTGPREGAGFAPPSFDCLDAFDFDRDGDIDTADWITFLGLTGRTAVASADPPARRAGGMQLLVYPNPTRGPVTIGFSGAVGGPVDLGIFDVVGARVWRGGRAQGSSGEATFVWSGTDSNGRPLRPGIYFLRARDGRQVLRRTLVLVR